MKNLKKFEKNTIIQNEKAAIKGGDKTPIGPKTPPNPCFDPSDKLAWFCPACSRG